MITRERKQAMEDEAQRWDAAAQEKASRGDSFGAAFARDQARSVRAEIRKLENPRPAVRFG